MRARAQRSGAAAICPILGLLMVAVLCACGQAPLPATAAPGSQAPQPATAEASGEQPLPDASASTAQPITLEGRDASFALSLRVEGDVVDAGVPIVASAVLTWEGPEPIVTVWGSGGGPVSFSLKQLDGDIAVDAVMTLDCAMHEFQRLVPVTVPFRKSGGFSDDDPHATFYRAYFADPLLRLPAGRWRVSGHAGGYLEPCEMDARTFGIGLDADIVVR